MNNSESYMDRSSSFSRNTSCSSFDDDRWQKELKMHKDFMPPELKINFIDVMVLYSEKNRADARKFCDHLKNDIKLNNDICVNAALYDEFVHQAGPRFKLLEIAIKSSTYIFFFMTKEFFEDTWIELSRDACLMASIYNKENNWCVVPVYTEDPKYSIPMILRALKGIDYYRNDSFYKLGVRGLIQNRLHQRLEKEKKQKELQDGWLQKYKRENMEKMETQLEMEQKIKGKDVNEVVLTGASQEHQRSTTYQGAENCTNGDLNSQTWEHQSQENDMTVNNSMQAVDHLLQEESVNLTEPASQGPSVFGDLPNMSLIDSQDSMMATGTMNLVNEDKKPLQGENPTGASHDKSLQDIGLFSLNPDVDGMHPESDDQSQDTQMTPLNQSPSCWGTEVTVEDEEDQSLETKSKDHSMLETKSKDHSMSVKKTKEGNEHYSSLSEKDLASEMKKDQDVHLWHKANGSNEKQVATVTPRLKVCKDRDGEKTDLDIVDRETNGDTGVRTIHETREITLYETEQTLPKIVDRDIYEISPFRKWPYTDLIRYLAMRPASPLLANIYPIPPVPLFAAYLGKSNQTSAQCTESSKGTLPQDELD